HRAYPPGPYLRKTSCPISHRGDGEVPGSGLRTGKRNGDPIAVDFNGRDSTRSIWPSEIVGVYPNFATGGAVRVLTRRSGLGDCKSLTIPASTGRRENGTLHGHEHAGPMIGADGLAYGPDFRKDQQQHRASIARQRVLRFFHLLGRCLSRLLVVVYHERIRPDAAGGALQPSASRVGAGAGLPVLPHV